MTFQNNCHNFYYEYFLLLKILKRLTNTRVLLFIKKKCFFLKKFNHLQKCFMLILKQIANCLLSYFLKE